MFHADPTSTRSSFPSFLCILILLGLVAPIASAQPPAQGDEFKVNTFGNNSQSNPDIDADGAGRFVVTWRSLGQDGDNLGVFARRYDADGSALGGELQVNAFTPGGQFNPALAVSPQGSFVVSWTDGAQPPRDGDGFGIFGRRFDADGQTISGDLQLHTTFTSDQERSSLAPLPDGGFVATWMSRQGDGDGETVYAQIFDGQGIPLGSEMQVNTTTANGQWDPVVASDAQGNFVISWYDYGFPSPDGDFSGVFSQRYDAQGNALGGETQVNATAAGFQFESAVAMRPSGEFVVVWDSYFQDGDRDGIFFQRFDNQGNAVGSETQVNTYTTGRQYSADVAMDSDGNFVVTWQNELGVGADGLVSDIMARTYDASGAATSGAFQVNTSPRPYLYFPVVASTGVDSFVVSWQGRSAGDDFDVLARRFGVVQTVDPNLVGLWALDEGVGAVAVNSADNGLDGVLESGAGWTSGQQGSAVILDGVDDLVRIVDPGVDSPIDVTDALTLAAWVRPDHLDGSTQVLISKDNAYELEVGKLGASVWDLRLNNQVVATAPTPLEEGVWQHVAANWDGATVRFYYNGLLDGSAPFSGTLVPNDDDLGLGGRPSPALVGGPVFHLEGALDHVAIYNRVLDDVELASMVLDTLTDVTPPLRSNLTPSSSLAVGTSLASLGLDTDENANCRYSTSPDVRFGDMTDLFSVTGGTSHSTNLPVVDGQIYTFYLRCQDSLGNTHSDDAVVQFGVGDSNLSDALAVWDLEEGSGCVAGGAGLDGNLGPDCPANAPLWTGGHDGGSGLKFDGVDDLVTIPSAPSLATPAGITMSAWIRHPGNSWYRALFDARDAGSDGYDLYLEPSSRLLIRINDQTLTGQATVADGTWHHVVGTYDGTTLRLFVDGVLDGELAIGPSTLDVTSDLRLGHHFSTLNFTYDGSLSRASLWDRALSPVEVLDLYLTTR